MVTIRNGSCLRETQFLFTICIPIATATGRVPCSYVCVAEVCRTAAVAPYVLFLRAPGDSGSQIL